jgi:ligand-binding sensor domain-containing protein
MKKIISLISAGFMLISFNGQAQNKVSNNSFNGDFQAKTFRSVFVDNNNIKWFLTEAGMVSFDDAAWKLQNKNSAVPALDLKDIVLNPSTPEVVLATPNGATTATLPIDEKSQVTNYTKETTPILSNNVVRVAVGKDGIHWFGTDKGVSAFSNNKWFTPAYDEIYPAEIFESYPITSMATNSKGDSLYVGTAGAGIARIFRNEVDGISGASVYAQWGPIILPSDNILSVMIASNGTKWFGTDMGLAKHTGNNTLDNWTVYTKAEGLVNDAVQAIAEDSNGKLWLGTQGGISTFDGTTWTSYTTADGLASNNILSVAVDKKGVVWFGTDNGVISFNNGQIVNYK